MPGALSRRDAASTAQGRTARTASRTLSGPSRPASITPPVDRGGTLEVRRILLFPREVDDARDRLAVAYSEDGVPSAHASILLLVQLDEIGAGILRLADENGDAESAVVGHGAGHRLRGEGFPPRG